MVQYPHPPPYEVREVMADHGRGWAVHSGHSPGVWYLVEYVDHQLRCSCKRGTIVYSAMVEGLAGWESACAHMKASVVKEGSYVQAK